MIWSKLFSDKQLRRIKRVEITNIMKLYEKKNFRGHDLTAHKASLQQKGFTQTQKDILIGTLLGDASMQAMKGNQLSNIKFEQKIGQIDYVNHLYEELQD